MEEFLLDDDDDEDVEAVYNDFHNIDCDNTIPDAESTLHHLQAHLHDIDSMSLNDDYVPPSSHKDDQDPAFSNCPSNINPDPSPSSALSLPSILHSDDASPSDVSVDKNSHPIPVSSADPITGIVDGSFQPSVLIEDCDGYLAMEWSLDGELYYDTFPMDEDIDKSLDVMYVGGPGEKCAKFKINFFPKAKVVLYICGSLYCVSKV